PGMGALGPRPGFQPGARPYGAITPSIFVNGRITAIDLVGGSVTLTPEAGTSGGQAVRLTPATRIPHYLPTSQSELKVGDSILAVAQPVELEVGELQVDRTLPAMAAPPVGAGAGATIASGALGPPSVSSGPARFRGQVRS